MESPRSPILPARIAGSPPPASDRQLRVDSRTALVEGALLSRQVAPSSEIAPQTFVVGRFPQSSLL